METFEAISGRFSYRGIYKDTPIPREHLKMIMQAGLDAPSGCNKQTTSIIAVDDKELLARLRAVMNLSKGETAPSMICVLTRKIIAYKNRMFYVQDYSAAIQNMLLAIHALGYASCWIEGNITEEDRICDKMAAILGVPDEYELVAFLPVGIAADEGRRVQKKAFEARAWFNGFHADS